MRLWRCWVESSAGRNPWQKAIQGSIPITQALPNTGASFSLSSWMMLLPTIFLLASLILKLMISLSRSSYAGIWLLFLNNSQELSVRARRLLIPSSFCWKKSWENNWIKKLSTFSTKKEKQLTSGEWRSTRLILALRSSSRICWRLLNNLLEMQDIHTDTSTQWTRRRTSSQKRRIMT